MLNADGQQYRSLTHVCIHALKPIQKPLVFSAKINCFNG